MPPRYPHWATRGSGCGTSSLLLPWPHVNRHGILSATPRDSAPPPREPRRRRGPGIKTAQLLAKEESPWAEDVAGTLLVVLSGRRWPALVLVCCGAYCSRLPAACRPCLYQSPSSLASSPRAVSRCPLRLMGHPPPWLPWRSIVSQAHSRSAA